MLAAYGSGDFTYLECCEGKDHDDGTCEVVYRDEFGDLNDDEFTHYMLVAALPPAPESVATTLKNDPSVQYLGKISIGDALNMALDANAPLPKLIKDDDSK
jgi:hypothetical protein